MPLEFAKPEMKDCIEKCWACRTECEEVLFRYCLPKGGKHAAQEHVLLMADCIQICQTSADFMTRGSDLHTYICAACAEVCDACAESCEQMDDERMQQCAELCRACAQECRRMGQSPRKQAA